jgi:uncharacterized protein (DUF2164 family)
MSHTQKQILYSERKRIALSLLKKYFETERDEQLGDLETELLYEFFERELAPYYYNQAADDAHAWFIQRLPYLEADLECSKRTPKWSMHDHEVSHILLNIRECQTSMVC